MFVHSGCYSRLVSNKLEWRRNTSKSLDNGTGRLALNRPVLEDLSGLHAICSDPGVWTHFPSLRHTKPEQTLKMLEGWIASWERDGLGTWVVRQPSSAQIIGYGGCVIRHETFWNLGYRFATTAQGKGLATELATAVMQQAKASRPDLPIVAYLLEHNLASGRVAEKVGLSLIHRGIDAGNPDSTAMRLVYADRSLTKQELEQIMG